MAGVSHAATMIATTGLFCTYKHNRGAVSIESVVHFELAKCSLVRAPGHTTHAQSRREDCSCLLLFTHCRCGGNFGTMDFPPDRYMAYAKSRECTANWMCGSVRLAGWNARHSGSVCTGPQGCFPSLLHPNSILKVNAVCFLQPV